MENTLLGYVIIDPATDMFVHHDFNRVPQTWLSHEEALPIPRADAYLRVAQYVRENPEASGPIVEDVHRELTPLERTSQSLAQRLLQLTEAHGLDLGLTREQVETKIAQELQSLRT